MPRPHRAATLLLAMALVAGCESERAPGATPSAPAPAVAASAPAPMQDVVETRPDYIIGISYPEVAANHPLLARALKAYAEGARAELMRAVAALGGRRPPAPYDLSLQFSGLVERPHIVVVAADGSSYTGGAHGRPLVARFVWLPGRAELLVAERLLAAPDGWQVIAEAVREILLAELSQRLDADAPEAGDRAGQWQLGSQMIEAGTAPLAANFSRFEPVVDADGKIRSLRFVFPAAQVAPYEEGTRVAEIPAATLLPLLADEYRPMFRGG